MIVFAVISSLLNFYACDLPENPFPGLELFKWNMIVPDNELAVCANGSRYKFFISPSDKSNNVLIYFQGGGSCWDFSSCGGRKGIRGAINRDGIPDDFMDDCSIPSIMSPFVWRTHPLDDYQTRDWTIIFLPYCTGDVFTGDTTATYTDPEGNASDLVYHHAGHENVMAVLDWMTQGEYAKYFDDIPTLLVTGSSAGGAGAFLNYFFIREALGSRVGQGILLNDSGPVYPAEDKPEYPADLSELDGDAPHTYENYPHSLPSQRTVKAVWRTDSVFGLIQDAIKGDDDLMALYRETNIGDSLNRLLSAKYAEDRIAHTQFTMDEEYASYIYERFYPNDIDMDDDGLDVMLGYWAEEQQMLIDLYDELCETNGNVGYFIPYYRPFIESHTTCSIASIGTLIDRDINGDYIYIDIKDYIRDLLNPDVPMCQLRYIEHASYLEANGPVPNFVRDLIDFLDENLELL